MSAALDAKLGELLLRLDDARLRRHAAAAIAEVIERERSRLAEAESLVDWLRGADDVPDPAAEALDDALGAIGDDDD